MGYMTLLGSGAGNPYGAYLLYDTFTDLNGTALTSHVMDKGPGWTASTGTVDIQNNKAHGSTYSSNISDAKVNSGQSDITLQLDCILGNAATTDAVGVFLRFTDENNLWQARISGVSQIIEIIEHVSGVATQRASVSFSSTPGTTYTLKVVANGTTITASVGATSCTYGSAASNLTATIVGIRFVQVGSATLGDYGDNFQVFL